MRLRWGTDWPLALVLLWGLAVAWLLRGTYFVGMYNDDVTYVALARALSHGLGYVDVSTWPPLMQTRWAPGFALSLAPAQWLRPHDLQLLRYQGAVTAEFCLIVLYVYLRRSFTEWAAPVAFLTANSLLWGHLAAEAMSDIDFLTLVLLSLALGEGRDWRKTSSRAWFWIGLFVTLCYSIRILGAVLVAALAWTAWRGGGRRGLTITMSIGLAFILPYMAMQLGGGYGGLTAQSHWQTLVDNFFYQSIAVPLCAWMDPHPYTPHGWTNPLLLLLCLFTWGGAARGWWSLWQQGRCLTGLYSLGMSLLLVFFPLFPITGARSDLTVLPFVCLYLLEGARVIAGRRAALVLAAAMAVTQTASWWPATHASLAPPDPAALAWVAANVPEPVVLSTDGWPWLYADKVMLHQDDFFTHQHPEELLATCDEAGCRTLVTLEGSGFQEWAARRPFLAEPVGPKPAGIALFRLKLPRRAFVHAYAAYRNGERWSNLGDYPEAAERLRDAIALEPWMPNAHASLGYVLWRMGQNTDALRELEIALALEPQLQRAIAMHNRIPRS